MPAERVSMRRVREILRLKYECDASDRAIAVAMGVARSTVRLYLDRVGAAGLVWPLPATLTEAALEALLFAPLGGSQPGKRFKDEPEWTRVHHELRRPGVTLLLLWEGWAVERINRAGNPGGYGYSRWCELYRSWEGRLSPTMRQAHPAGERLFVDYAGHTVEVLEAETGELRPAQVFVAVLGASNYTYAEATWSQSLPDWIGSHVRTLEFLDGVPRQVVPDNLRAGVLRANWYEPGINPTYRDLAAHYATAILPTPVSSADITPWDRFAMVRRPRDKAKVEAGVLVVERWILARLRNHRFLSLVELNAAIAALVADLNARPMRKLGVSRRQLFEELDRPALSPLPAEPFVYAEWRIRRVSLDYHVDVDGHYYSVPHRLLREPVEARAPLWNSSTLPEHMPQSHRRHAEWTIERIGQEAATIGAATATLVDLILRGRPHPEQGFRACLGILRLVRGFGRERVEAACARGLEIGARSYGSVQSILRHGLDQRPRAPTRADELPLVHPNIRGSRYYH